MGWIKNPIMHVTYADGSAVRQSRSVPIPPTGNTRAVVKGEHFSIIRRKAKTGKYYVVVVDKDRRAHRTDDKGNCTVDLNGIHYQFSLGSDIVREEDKSFVNFLLYSLVCHFFFISSFGLLNLVVPEREPEIKPVVDTKRIKSVMDKIKKRKRKPVVKKKPPKPKPKKRAVAKAPTKKPVKKQARKPTPKKAVARPTKKAPKRLKKTGPPPAKLARSRRRPRRKPAQPSQLVLAARAKAKAKQAAKAKLTKSLSFLSSSKSKFSVKPTTYASNKKKYDANAKNTVVGKITKGKSVLKNVGTRPSNSGPIQTKGVRSIERGMAFSEDGVRGGRGKTLNQVRGKVAQNDLYRQGGGGDIGGALDGGGGISLSGKGRISESAVEKALAKRIHKLQYCYEKSLLSDPSLTGTLTMSWNIVPGGQAKKIRVVRSQLNHKGLHRCVSAELSKIPFPSPVGGSVTIKKRFSFSSSSI